MIYVHAPNYVLRNAFYKFQFHKHARKRQLIIKLPLNWTLINYSNQDN